ncbi:flagellar brake protein [Halanaerobaculum tunisiense]
MREGRVVSNFKLTARLDINQQVGFEMLSGSYDGEYPTQVTDIIDNQTFVINTPFSQGDPIPVAINNRVNIKLRETGGIYIIPVRVIGREIDATQLLRVKLRDQVTKVQQREFFRLEVYESTNYRIIVSNQPEIEEFLTDLTTRETTGQQEEINFSNEAFLQDISAGGAKLLTDEQVAKESIIELEMEFIDTSFDRILAQVVRQSERDKDVERRYELGVKFINCRRRKRDELTKWLFAKQRELRQKGLI